MCIVCVHKSAADKADDTQTQQTIANPTADDDATAAPAPDDDVTGAGDGATLTAGDTRKVVPRSPMVLAIKQEKLDDDAVTKVLLILSVYT